MIRAFLSEFWSRYRIGERTLSANSLGDVVKEQGDLSRWPAHGHNLVRGLRFWTELGSAADVHPYSRGQVTPAHTQVDDRVRVKFPGSPTPHVHETKCILQDILSIIIQNV